MTKERIAELRKSWANNLLHECLDEIERLQAAKPECEVCKGLKWGVWYEETGNLIAAFVYSDQASKWAAATYSGKCRIARLRPVPICSECGRPKEDE